MAIWLLRILYDNHKMFASEVPTPRAQAVENSMLDPALQHMMDAVHRFEGTVNQMLGDGIMALYLTLG